MNSACAILLAAGSGQRMQSSTDKVLLPLADQPILHHSLQVFQQHPHIHHILITYRDSQQRSALQQDLPPSDTPLHWIAGGTERMHSVHHALQAVPPDCAYALIHDAARPLITAQHIDQLLQALQQAPAAVLAKPVSDTIKRLPPHSQPQQAVALEDLERERLWAMETPQAFHTQLIQEAYQNAIDQQHNLTDDVAALGALGHPVQLIPNPQPNPKITYPHDLALLQFLQKQHSTS